MHPKKEICRYFQRGSCQYGTRCKFLHPTSQQTQTNPFGFGKQTGTPTQQPAANPFGFGVQNNVYSRGADGFGSKPNQPKKFENTWSRFSPINNSASASRQPDNQPQAANHRCNEPESCKSVILEDFKKENPLWKLTCYGHSRNGPCDIVGDISYEELRALAYDDYKHGKSLQAIVDRERNLLNSRLIEFQNLVEKPYAVSSSATTSSSQNLFAGGSINAPIVNNGLAAQVSSFSQLSGPPNTRSAAVPNYSFGQTSAFQNNSQPSGLLETNNSPLNSSGTFASQPGQSNQVQNNNKPSSLFQTNNSTFNSAFVSSQFGTTRSSNGTISAQQNSFSTFGNSSQTGNLFSNEPSLSIQLINNISKENSNVDGSIWTKAEWKWNAGEIPEEVPPDAYIR